jgi:hypothetical protein
VTRRTRDHVTYQAVRLRALGKGVDDAVERAEARLRNLESSYHAWILAETEKLQADVREFLDARHFENSREVLRAQALEYSANAVQFGFPIAGRIAQNLCRLLDHPALHSLPPVVLHRHGEAMSSVVRAGPDEGKNVTAKSIAEALEKIVAQLFEPASA